MTSNLTMAFSPEPHFGVNIEEEINQSYVKACRLQFDVPHDKLVEAIEYLGRLVGGIVANRDSKKLYQAVQHIDYLRSRPLVDGTGVFKEYSHDELQNILVKGINYSVEDFEKLVKEFEDNFGYLPSPSEFVDFYEEKKGIVKLEEKVKKLQGNQLALEQERQERQAMEQEIQQALEQERQKRQALELEIQEERQKRQALELEIQEERQKRQALELELQRMREREEDQLEEEVRHKLQLVVCKICLEKEVEVLFLPCNHLVSCQGCKERLAQKKCPFCRDTYQATIRVYLA